MEYLSLADQMRNVDARIDLITYSAVPFVTVE